MSDRIRFEAVVERLAPEVPRFVVYAGKAWEETRKFLVQVWMNGVGIGLRSLIPWKERGWHFGLSEPMCRAVGIETGHRVSVEMRRLGDWLPVELEALVKSDEAARKAWNRLAAGDRRDLILFVAEAKKAETRAKRARRLVEANRIR